MSVGAVYDRARSYIQNTQGGFEVRGHSPRLPQWQSGDEVRIPRPLTLLRNSGGEEFRRRATNSLLLVDEFVTDGADLLVPGFQLLG
jgi:hypothetical protein